jgi:hypothetical protein
MRRAKHQAVSDEEARKIILTWMHKSDTEAAVVASTYLEDRLGFAIKSRFVKLPETGDVTKHLTEAALFQGYGPLASFYAKIDIGFALGLYDNTRRTELHLIRSIRNEFAHTIEPVTFLNQNVAKKCGKLATYRRTQAAKMIAELLVSEGELPNKIAYLITCSFISGALDSASEFPVSHLYPRQ